MTNSRAQAAADAIAAAKTQHDQVRAALIRRLPAIFNCPVEDVEEFKFSDNGQSQSGILVSGGVRYRYQIGQGRKVLEQVEN